MGWLRADDCAPIFCKTLALQVLVPRDDVKQVFTKKFGAAVIYLRSCLCDVHNLTHDLADGVGDAQVENISGLSLNLLTMG